MPPPTTRISVFRVVIAIFFSVYKAFDSFYDSFLKSLELPNIIIHAIVYQGPKDRLPSVFETLNTSSVSLTKYEVFSSQWPITKIKIEDDELVDRVWSKYESLKKSSSFDVELTREQIAENGMTLFEYCFGFSEIVCSENKPYSFLFNRNKKIRIQQALKYCLLPVACR